MKPRLRASILCAPTTDQSDVGVYGVGGLFNIGIKQGELDQLIELLQETNGLNSLKEIATNIGLTLADVKDVVSELVDKRLVIDASVAGPDTYQVERFLERFDVLKRLLRFDLARHELFRVLPSHAKKTRLLRSIFVEYLFLIAAAGEHIGQALSNCDAEVRPLLQAFLSTERDHYRSIASKLTPLFPGVNILEQVEMMASTEAIILKTQRLASEEVLAYIAACDFTEMDCPINSNEKVELLGFDLIGTVYEWAFDAYVEHAQADFAHGHSSLLRECLKGSSVISRSAVTNIVRQVHNVKHYYDNLHSEILRRYASSGCPLPRMRFNADDIMDIP